MGKKLADIFMMVETRNLVLGKSNPGKSNWDLNDFK